MDATQFNQYQELQAKKAQAELDDRRLRMATDGRNHKVKTQSRRVRVCDGSTSAAVREWIDDIEMARHYLPDDEAVCEVVANTAQGSLRKAYERFMQAQADRSQVTWKAVKKHLRAGFLSADEDEYLRTAMEKVKQTDFETTAAYARRFLEAADSAYSQDKRNLAENRIILTAYIRGLHNRDMVKRLVQEARPATVEEAVQAVERFAADEERLVRYGWSDDTTHEPMEIGEVQTAKTAMTEALEKLTRQVNGLQREFSRMKAAQKSPDAKPILKMKKNLGKWKKAWTEDGRPVCFECGEAGHMGKECRAKKMAATRPGNA